MKNMTIYRLPLRLEDEQKLTKEKLDNLRGNSAFNAFVDRLADIIADERNIYESTQADEYKRGRLNALTDLYTQLNGRN